MSAALYLSRWYLPPTLLAKTYSSSPWKSLPRRCCQSCSASVGGIAIERSPFSDFESGHVGQPNGGGPVPEMNGGDLVLSGTRADFGQNGGPVVLLQFTNHGSDQFQKITRAEADRGKLAYGLAGQQGDYKNFAQHFAIVLDQQLESTPYIDFKRNPHGIAGLYVEIDLGVGGTFKEAKRLALVLQTGALPITFVRVSQRAIP